MKLRCLPEDFIVTELTNRVSTDGSFALYELQKRSIATLEAMQHIQRSWNLPPKNLSHGGLKDRHAVTSQFLTIRQGPTADFSHDLFELEYLGQTDTPYGAHDIVGNRFEIVLRSLSTEECNSIHQRVESAAKQGVANYFDEQRFGSLGESQEFVAAKWCMKDYERALWLALAEYNPHDSPNDREQKQILRDLWGQWEDCKAALERSHRRSVVTYLVDHPDKFKKAFALVNDNLRGLFLSAFQSAVWNRMLAETLRDPNDENTSATEVTIGDTTVPLLSESNRSRCRFKELPLPSIRCKGISNDVRELCNRALKPYDMTLQQMKVHFPRDRWFSRALRKTIIIPSNLSVEEEADEQYRDRRKLTLRFDCPRGSYATMLVRVLTASDAASPDSDDADELEETS